MLFELKHSTQPLPVAYANFVWDLLFVNALKLLPKFVLPSTLVCIPFPLLCLVDDLRPSGMYALPLPDQYVVFRVIAAVYQCLA